MPNEDYFHVIRPSLSGAIKLLRELNIGKLMNIGFSFECKYRYVLEYKTLRLFPYISKRVYQSTNICVERSHERRNVTHPARVETQPCGGNSRSVRQECATWQPKSPRVRGGASTSFYRLPSAASNALSQSQPSNVVLTVPELIRNAFTAEYLFRHKLIVC